MTTYAAMLLLGGVCLVFRWLFILLVPASRLPGGARHALGYLAPAVLAALVAAETRSATLHQPAWEVGYVLVTVALVGLVARRSGSLLAAISVGAAAAVLLDLVLLG